MTDRVPTSARLAKDTTTSGAARIGVSSITGLLSGAATTVQAALADIITQLGNKQSTSAKDQNSGYVGLAPSQGTRTGLKFLRDDGTWQTVAGGSAPIVQNNDVTVSSGATTLDFSSAFAVTESPAGEANVAPSFGTASGTVAQGNDSRFTKYSHSTFFYSGDVATKTGLGHDPIFQAVTVDSIRVMCDSAPAGGTVTVDVKKEAGGPGGTVSTVGSVTLAIASKSGSTTGLSVSLAAGDSLRLDVTTNAGYTAASCKNLTAKARYSY